jgi:hypothetical protein
MVKPIALLLTLACLSSCSTVTSREPLGQRSGQTGLQKTLDGAWRCEDAVFFVKCLAEDELQIGWVEWQGGHFTIREARAEITADEEVSYLNVIDLGPEAVPMRHTFLRIARLSATTIVLFPPRVEAFEAAVTAGRLAGKVEKKRSVFGDDDVTVWLDVSREVLADFVEPAKAAEQFDLETPLVFERIEASLN